MKIVDLKEGIRQKKKKKHDPWGKVIALGHCWSVCKVRETMTRWSITQLRESYDIQVQGPSTIGVKEKEELIKIVALEEGSLRKKISMSHELKLSPKDIVGVVCEVRETMRR